MPLSWHQWCMAQNWNRPGSSSFQLGTARVVSFCLSSLQNEEPARDHGTITAIMSPKKVIQLAMGVGPGRVWAKSIGNWVTKHLQKNYSQTIKWWRKPVAWSRPHRTLRLPDQDISWATRLVVGSWNRFLSNLKPAHVSTHHFLKRDFWTLNKYKLYLALSLSVSMNPWLPPSAARHSKWANKSEQDFATSTEIPDSQIFNDCWGIQTGKWRAPETNICTCYHGFPFLVAFQHHGKILTARKRSTHLQSL